MRDAIRIVNTILYCCHWRETVAFYRDVLELPVTFENDWFIEFKVNDHARLSVANEKRATIKSSKGAGLTLAFKVDRADNVWQSFLSRGIDVGKISDHPWGGRSFFMFDPEGNRLEVWSM